MSGHIRHLSIWHSHVFLVNSRLGHFSAALSLERPFSRGYRTILPSSLTMNHSSALVCSTRPRVSVCGTGAAWVKLSGFSREYGYPRYWIPPGRNPYCQVQLSRWICLPRSTPTPFNGDFRRPAVVSLLRLHVAPCGSDGILTVSAIAIAVRLRLRTRLTPG